MSIDLALFASQLSRYVSLLTLPCGPVEPTQLELKFKPQEKDVGTLLTFPGVCAANIRVCEMLRFASFGSLLRFQIAFVGTTALDPAEHAVAAASLAFHTSIRANLVALPLPLPLPMPLQMFAPLPPPISLTATLLPLPLSSLPPADSTPVAVAVATVAIDADFSRALGNTGNRIHNTQNTHNTHTEVVLDMNFAGQALPLMPRRLRVVTGMQAPLFLRMGANKKCLSVAITSNGTLFTTIEDKLSCKTDVLVFDADGTLQPLLFFRFIRSLQLVHCVAFDEKTETLLLTANFYHCVPSSLVAVDAVSKTVLWFSALKCSHNRIAILPSSGHSSGQSSGQSVIVVSDDLFDELSVHSLSKGTRITSVHAEFASFLAADPVSFCASPTVFVSTGFNISAFCWDGAALVHDGIITPSSSNVPAAFDHPLAVISSSCGTSCLVVGDFGSSKINIYTLPDRRWIHTHELTGMHITNLAADPSGTALAVCDDSSENINVLPWPLPGMPLMPILKPNGVFPSSLSSFFDRNCAIS